MPSQLESSGEIEDLDAAIAAMSGEAQWLTQGDQLDVSLSETIRVVASSVPVRPSPAFATRLEWALTQHAQPSTAHGRPRRRWAGNHNAALAPSPATVVGAQSLPARRWHTANVSLAVLLIVLVGGIWRTLVMTGSSGPAGRAAVSVDIDGPLPSSNIATLTLDRFHLDEGGSMSNYSLGPTMILVETGTLTLPGYGAIPTQVLREGEATAAARATVLRPRNDGEEPVTFLLAGLVADGNVARLPFDDGSVTIEHFMTETFADDMPDGATFTMRRDEIESGSSVKYAAIDGPSWVIGAGGALAVTVSGDDVPDGFQPGVEQLAVPLRRLAVRPGVDLLARNVGESPITVITISVQPLPPRVATT